MGAWAVQPNDRKLKGENFTCPVCTGTVTIEEPRKLEFALGGEANLEVVDRFCYLGDMIEDGGGATAAAKTRVKCAWAKFRQLMPVLTCRGASLVLKGKIYTACVQCFGVRERDLAIEGRVLEQVRKNRKDDG